MLNRPRIRAFINGVVYCLLLSRPASAQADVTAAATAHRAAAETAQPGDRVVFRLLGEMPFADTTSVDDQGRIPIVKIGLVQVTVMPIGQIRDTLTARLAKFLANPVVDISVLRKVTVGGAVTKPDIYYMDLTSQVRDAIARAGGVIENGDDRKVEIIRNGQHISIPNWQRIESPDADLRSGDQIVVGRRNWFAINAFQFASVALVVASLLISLHK